MPAIPDPLVVPRNVELDTAWQEINRAPDTNGSRNCEWIVSDGEYWRLVSVSFYQDSDATAGQHTNRVTFQTADNVVAVEIDSAGSLDPNRSMPFLYALGLEPIAVQNRYSQNPLPNILWPPRTKIDVKLLGEITGAFDSTPSVIVDHFLWTGAADTLPPGPIAANPIA